MSDPLEIRTESERKSMRPTKRNSVLIFLLSQDATQHQEQLVWLLRAELGHGSPSRLVALGHGFGPEGRPDSIRVPTRPSAGENHLAASRLKIIPRNDKVSAYARSLRSSDLPLLPLADHDD